MAEVEAVEADSSHTFSKHTHQQFGIGVIYRGAQKSLSGRGTVEAQAGDVITVNPGEVHDGEPVNEAGRFWKMLYFEPSVISEVVLDLNGGGALDYEFASPVISDPGISHRFQELFSAMTAETYVPILGQETLLMLLADVLHRQMQLHHERFVPREILKARQLIDDDPTAMITLSEMARESGLSRFQVVRGFSRATGLTPHAYLVQRRVDIARKLIAAGTPLAETAVTCGFADQSHMTRIFIRKYGISPSSYMRVVA